MRFASITMLTLACSLSSFAMASGVDAVYYPDQGKVVLPNLKIGNQVYYAILNKIGTTNDFRLDLTSVNNLSVPLTFTPAGAGDLVGSFSPVDELTSTVTFNANGTYSVMQGPTTDPSCPKAGGLETGTWQYEASTGVLSAVALTDANGECGLSHPSGITRIKKVGNDLYFIEQEKGQNIEMRLTRK